MYKLFISNLKMLVRNKQSLFWSLMFPLMFTIIFGLFFGRSNSMNGTIHIINQSNSQLSKQIVSGIKDQNLFNIKETTDFSSSQDLVKKNKISAVLVIPKDFANPKPGSPNTIEVYYDPASTQAVGILTNLTNAFLNQASFSAQKAKPLYLIKQIRVGTNKPFSYFDYVLAGILGLALMNSSIMGMAVGISKYKEDKILKRITTTPLKSWKFILAEVLSRLILNALQISLILFIGIVIFHGHVYGNFAALIGIIFIGAILFQLLGFTLAAFAKNANAAEGMASAIAIPMMFLAGVFFPIDALPQWLSNILQFLPLAPFLRMVRSIAIESASPFTNPINIIIVVSWIVVFSTVSLLKFRMSEEN